MAVGRLSGSYALSRAADQVMTPVYASLFRPPGRFKVRAALERQLNPRWMTAREPADRRRELGA
jgi:hypothetical protein